MMTSEDNTASLTRLERRVGRLSVLCGLLGVTLLLSFVLPTHEVKARRFVLMDEAGDQRGMWRVRGRDAALILQDPSGSWRAVISVNEDESELWLSRRDGTQGVKVRTTGGSSELELSGGREEGHTRFTMTTDGPGLVVVNEAGEPVASLP